MIKVLFNRWFLNSGRTSVVLRNTAISFFLRGLSMLIGFILIPLCLKAVTQKEYGIILTITSIISWIAFFDIGIGNGLRTRLGQAMAEGNTGLARKYVSTAYFYVVAIFAAILLLYSLIHPFINWYRLLNIKVADVAGLKSSMYLIVTLFVLRFILQLIGVLLLADQRSYLSDAILPISNILTLAAIYFFYFLGIANFNNLIFSICGAPIIVLIIYTIVLFAGKYKWLKPSLKFVDHSLKKDLLSLGVKFFLVQVIALIIFSTSNFLIAQLYQMNDVTVFNIASRYYGITLMIFEIALNPMWGAFTNAWHQDDKSWILKALQRMVFLNAALILLALVLFFYYEPLSKLWLGKSILVAPLFALTLVVYNFQIAFNNTFSYFLNSIGKVNLQLYAAITGGIINIPLTIFLARNTGWGLASICVANIVSLLPGSVFAVIQVRKILHNRARGIWFS